MEQEKLKLMNNSILDLFRDLMNGDIMYSRDRLDTVMGNCIGEVYEDVAGSFNDKVSRGEEITTEDLINLRDNLQAFGEDYGVGEVDEYIREIDEMLAKK